MAAKTEGKRLSRAVANIYTRKWSFLVAFLIMLFALVTLLARLDFLPEPKVAQTATAAYKKVQNPLDTLPVETPMRIVVPSIGMEVHINNPASTDITALDTALLTGAVRYPTSAKPGEKGNTILFGHSSYLPVVQNQAYKAFDGIQDLVKGDRITVYGNGTAYVYAVDSVHSANAQQDAIPLTDTGHTLTLVTCDSFASKSDRFVVTATLVESYPLAK